MMTVVIGDIILWICTNITNESGRTLKPTSANYLQHAYIRGPDLCTWEKSVNKTHKDLCPDGAYSEAGRRGGIQK